VYKLILFLLILIAALQYRLWLGDGSIREYRELQAKIAEMEQEGERRRARNAAIEADVNDLKNGTEAVEEQARRELGMIKPGETFVQIYESPPPPEPPVKASTSETNPAPSKRRVIKPKTEPAPPAAPSGDAIQ
jgi:cell division protein FtsB